MKIDKTHDHCHNHQTLPPSSTSQTTMYWSPSSTLIIVDDSDDEAEQQPPQREATAARLDVPVEPAAARASTSTETGRHISSCPSLSRSADTHDEAGEPTASTAPAHTHAQPSSEHLAHCQVCQHPHGLLHFYEPAEGGVRLFTSCRACRQSDGWTADDADVTYQCRCGSVLRVTGKKRHERTKKHKAWSRGARAAHASIIA